jgi:tripartite-type tricarboxylate transporter receptor subunit TctC
MNVRHQAGLAGVLALSLVAAAVPAGAQEYPAKDLRAICVFPPNTNPDAFVRFYAEKLSTLAGRPVNVENKGGAAGTAGAEAAAKAKGDGYTFVILPGATLASAPHTFKKLKFNPAKDFAPVTTLAKAGYVILVDAKSPIKTLAELTARLKEKGDRASYGYSINPELVAAELYKKQAGVKPSKVQYRDVQTPLSDLVAGNIDVLVEDASFAIAQSAKVRAIAVTAAQRLPGLPNVPTMAEAGLPNYGEVVTWWGVFVPVKTSKPIAEKLEGWFNQIASSDDAKAFLARMGAVPMVGSSRTLADLLAADTSKWGDYVKLAGIEKQ